MENRCKQKINWNLNLSIPTFISIGIGRVLKKINYTSNLNVVPRYISVAYVGRYSVFLFIKK
jgi:hypothetical protein